MSRFNWTDREELMCLVIYKKLMKNDFEKGLKSTLCYEMASKPNTPTFDSIILKIGNYKYLFTNGAKGLKNCSKGNKRIYNEFKDCSIKEIEDEIKKLEGAKNIFTTKKQEKKPQKELDNEKEKLDFNPQFKKALACMKEGKNLFITGKAGTGKSTLLKHFCSETKEKPVVLAPTGVAALNVNGLTIHSFFKFNFNVTPENLKSKKTAPTNAEIYKKLKILVIDEISMVRADLLDCIDVFLSRWGPVKKKPFGGVQMVFIGDLYQLPPIVTFEEKAFFKLVYETPFFFSSKVYKKFPIEMIELEKVYRQKNKDFINLLNRIRNNSVNEEDLHALNKRHLPSFEPKKNEFYINLTATNKKADNINTDKLESLKEIEHQSQAYIHGNFGKEYYPTYLDLRFKVGAQVMFLNNDSSRRWVNGSIGVITKVNENKECLTVRLHSDNEDVFVYRHTWDVYKVIYSKQKKTLEQDMVGSFIQYPIRLAWAITIHKSQGKSFDRVIIDSEGMFANGQAYVALSRCRSFETLVLKTPMKKTFIKTDYRIFNFMNSHLYQKAEQNMPAKEKIKMIETAIECKKNLKMSYFKANGIIEKRKAYPIQVGVLSFKDKEFQGMLAVCLKDKKEKNFRLDRILELDWD